MSCVYVPATPYEMLFYDSDVDEMSDLLEKFHIAAYSQ